MLPAIPPVVPIDCPTDDEALADFEALRRVRTDGMVRRAEWQSRSVVPGPIHPLVLGMVTTGLKSSNRFHWSARMACESHASTSVVRSWYSTRFRKSLESSAFYADSPKSALAMRRYIPAQFRPAAAMALLRATEARTWFDPCGGWGDRLSGALAEGIDTYYARDTNPHVFGGYSQQVARLASSTRVVVEYKGSEIDCPAPGHFDLCFTSPPYYKIEKYDGADASHRLHPTFAKWIDGFLRPMVTNAVASLRIGGILALNLSDVYADHRQNEIVGPTVDAAVAAGATYLGAIGYAIGGRINRRNAKSSDAGWAEPVVLFAKGAGAPPVLDNLRRMASEGQSELFGGAA